MFSILLHLLLAINVFVALLIILVVLMQRPKNEGLGAAFGGGVTENLFGVQTTNVLANLTRWLGGIFFVNSLVLGYMYSHSPENESSLAQRLKKSAAVVPATPTPATPLPGATPAAGPAAAPAAPSTEPATAPVPATPGLDGKTPAPAPVPGAAPAPGAAPQAEAVPAPSAAPAPAVSAPVPTAPAPTDAVAPAPAAPAPVTPAPAAPVVPGAQ